MLRFLSAFEQELMMVSISKIVIPTLFIAFILGVEANAQKKPRKITVKKTSATVIPPLEVRAAREKVEVQLANVNLFIDVLGPIAQGIETLEKAAQTKRLSAKTAERNDGNKQKVIEAIRNLKTGLSNLESEFRTKPPLAKFRPNIEGIGDLAAASEDNAIAGRFVESKEPLRDIARKLTDTLALFPR